MQADPNLIMLDQLVRVCLFQVIQACIWVGVGAVAVRVLFWRKKGKKGKKRG